MAIFLSTNKASIVLLFSANASVAANLLFVFEFCSANYKLCSALLNSYLININIHIHLHICWKYTALLKEIKTEPAYVFIGREVQRCQTIRRAFLPLFTRTKTLLDFNFSWWVSPNIVRQRPSWSWSSNSRYVQDKVLELGVRKKKLRCKSCIATKASPSNKARSYT